MDWTIVAHVAGIVWTLDLAVLLAHIGRYRKKTRTWPGRFTWLLAATCAIGVAVNAARAIWGMSIISPQVSAVGGLVVALLLLAMIAVTVTLDSKRME